MSLTELTLAHSPDPDDVFMWWPITGMIDPADHSRLTRPPSLDTGRFTFRALPADIDVLNRRAIEQGDLDITAISINTYPRVRDRYALTSYGASIGYGYGPKVVVRSSAPSPTEQEAAGSLSKSDRAVLTNPATTIAVPGTRTTAFLLLSLLLGRGTFRFIEMPFDRILPAVASGEAQAGLLIHQSQLTFPELGLRQAVDVGAWWLAETGLPLPLGGNVIKRDLDSRFGPGSLQQVTDLLAASLRHALEHREDSLAYAMRFAPELTRAQAERYIDMYVSNLTQDMGDAGLAAVRCLLKSAHDAGLSPNPGEVSLLRPSTSLTPNPS